MRKNSYTQLAFASFIFALLLFLLCSVTSCNETIPFYKKEFSTEVKKQLIDQMTNSLLSKYYQGSVSERMVLEEALSFEPNNADLWREIGVPYGKRGLAAEYYEKYGKAVLNDPLNWQGWRGYMYLYFYRDYERAIADFDALDVLTPDIVDYPQSTSIHFMRAVCYLKLGQFDTAISYFDQHLKEELSSTTEDYIDPRTFLFLGITYFKKGDYSNAQKAVERGLKNHSSNANLLLWAAKLSQHFGASDKAVQLLDEAEKQYQLNSHNFRPYVEEFFQMYQSDIDELRVSLQESPIERR